MPSTPRRLLADPDKRALMRVHLLTSVPLLAGVYSYYDGLRFPDAGVPLPPDVELTQNDAAATLRVGMRIPLDAPVPARVVGLLVSYNGGDFSAVIAVRRFADLNLRADAPGVDVRFSLEGY